MPRKLHAAWAELSGSKARVPPTVAGELGPLGVISGLTGRLRVAEELLQPEAPELDRERREQVSREAWWAAVWRDPNSPYAWLAIRVHRVLGLVSCVERRSTPVTGWNSVAAEEPGQPTSTSGRRSRPS